MVAGSCFGVLLEGPARAMSSKEDEALTSLWILEMQGSVGHDSVQVSGDLETQGRLIFCQGLATWQIMMCTFDLWHATQLVVINDLYGAITSLLGKFSNANSDVTSAILLASLLQANAALAVGPHGRVQATPHVENSITQTLECRPQCCQCCEFNTRHVTGWIKCCGQALNYLWHQLQ